MWTFPGRMNRNSNAEQDKKWFIIAGLQPKKWEWIVLVVRLRNRNNPRHTLSLTFPAWYGILDLAEAYGWAPLDRVLPGAWLTETWDAVEGRPAVYAPAGTLYGEPLGMDQSGGGPLVQVENALHLAEALERAFLDYEPRRVPSTYYLFEPEDALSSYRPSIGAIRETIEFCRRGAFWVDRLR